jgi:hypothetical protein
MKNIELLTAMIAGRGPITIGEAADELKISRQAVSAMAKKYNLQMRDGRKTTTPMPTKKNHFDSARAVSSHFVGGASECTVAAHLLRLGIPVYRAMTFVSAADLVVDHDGVLLRIEVRSARIYKFGGMSYAQPTDTTRYDVLALVTPDGGVIYKPRPGVRFNPDGGEERK